MSVNTGATTTSNNNNNNNGNDTSDVYSSSNDITFSSNRPDFSADAIKKVLEKHLIHTTDDGTAIYISRIASNDFGPSFNPQMPALTKEDFAKANIFNDADYGTPRNTIFAENWRSFTLQWTEALTYLRSTEAHNGLLAIHLVDLKKQETAYDIRVLTKATTYVFYHDNSDRIDAVSAMPFNTINQFTRHNAEFSEPFKKTYVTDRGANGFPEVNSKLNLEKKHFNAKHMFQLISCEFNKLNKELQTAAQAFLTQQHAAKLSKDQYATELKNLIKLKRRRDLMWCDYELARKRNNIIWNDYSNWARTQPAANNSNTNNNNNNATNNNKTKTKNKHANKEKPRTTGRGRRKDNQRASTRPRKRQRKNNKNKKSRNKGDRRIAAATQESEAQVNIVLLFVH